DPEIVFREHRGTCQSKHDLIAALGLEIDLPIRKFVGAYRLDETIVEGATAVLVRHGLSYVPEIHCVLQFDGRFFDLTAGNCHGKKTDVAEMEAYFRVDPFASEAVTQTVHELCVDYYRRIDPRLAWRSVSELRQIAAECRSRASSTCESAAG